MIYDKLFILIRESLYLDQNLPELSELSEQEWKDIYNEMTVQAIISLPYEWLKKHPSPENEVYTKWLSTCYSQQAQWIRLMTEQTRLVNILNKYQIPFVIIKGSAAGMYYPYPYLRAAGDVDFLVRRTDYDKTAEVLEKDGFLLVRKKNPFFHHYEYSKNGICFELHRRMGSVKESDEKTLRLFENGIINRKMRKISGFYFPVLPDELNGLSLLIHIRQHLKSGLGLRQIIDWMMYVNSLPDAVWKEKTLPLLRDIGMEKLALTITAMCQKYLGLREIVTDIDQYPCKELMVYILEKGNFGRKSGKGGKVAYAFLFMGSPLHLLIRLQRNGLSRWSLAKKYRIVRPFAWMYEIKSFASELNKAHITPIMILRQRRRGVEQRKLFRELGLKIE